MKKYLALLLSVVLLLGLGACRGGEPEQTTSAPTQPSTEVTLPSETATVPTTEPVVLESQIGGVELTAMSPEEAAAALTEAASTYQLSLTVNGKAVTISAAELTLTLDEAALGKYLEALNGGAEAPETIFTYDREVLCSLLGSKLNVPATNAGITYNSSKKQFVVSEGVSGTEYDLNAAADLAGKAVGLLKAAAEGEITTTSVEPAVTASSDKIKTALNKANSYLKVSLSYTYTPDGGETATERINAEHISSFLSVNDALEVSVSKSAIESYAAQMGERHSGSDYKSSFVTTGGSTLGYTVTYYGQQVNQSALTEDIYKCLTEGISGTRTAPYRSKSTMPYGGSYVEINLSSQKMWVYKNGECVVSTSLVSGSVAEDCCTPTGVYSIYSKETERYLSGENYRSYVHYWMPFLRGYGLHDATWRYSFGGTIYHYDGSHGCVNLPLSAAKKTYNNVSVGTKVILYGGKTEVPPLEQKITGTTSYRVADNAEPFQLDAALKYTGTQMQYSSSNPNVVQVSADGTVTVTGVGSATITVSAPAFDFYTAAVLKVGITVYATETEPTDPPTEPTDPPTEPTDPPTEPTDPPTEPTDPPTEPTDPPTEPTDPPTDPTDPPTEPTDPPTEPTDPPTDPTDPTTEEPAP